MIQKLKAAASDFIGYAKAHPLFLFVVLTVVVVFAAAPFLAVYRKVRALPVASSVLPAK